MKTQQDILQDNLDNLCPDDFELTSIEQEEEREPEPKPEPDYFRGYQGSTTAYNRNVDYARGNRWWE